MMKNQSSTDDQQDADLLREIRESTLRENRRQVWKTVTGFILFLILAGLLVLTFINFSS